MVDSTAQDLLEALTAAGLTPVRAYSVIDQCQGPPLPGLSYAAGITAKLETDPVGDFERVASELEGSGADEMTLSIEVIDDCVRIPDGTSFLDFQDLEKDILPRD